MNKQISPKITALTFGILTISFLAAFCVVAWQEPSQVPPGGNAPTPLNVSATAQTKEGNLTINGILKTLQDMIVNIVTIKGDGSMSPNLNSDKLDDYHAADLLAGVVDKFGGSTLVNYGSYMPGPPASWNVSPCPAGWTQAGLGAGPSGLRFAMGSGAQHSFLFPTNISPAYRTCFLCP